MELWPRNLIGEIIDVFGFEPTIANGEATWDVAASTFV
jgi:hypothetical protein